MLTYGNMSVVFFLFFFFCDVRSSLMRGTPWCSSRRRQVYSFIKKHLRAFKSWLPAFLCLILLLTAMWILFHSCKMFAIGGSCLCAFISTIVQKERRWSGLQWQIYEYNITSPESFSKLANKNDLKYIFNICSA